ncbi:MAG TPA: polysaccharide deacetylase family protein [Allosphingosinicella sp.]|nr:polysaccharide deacetylase family protein [Allosphingosinicella sp.]
MEGLFALSLRAAKWVSAGGAILALLAGIVLTLHQISRARCFSVVGEAICRVETDAPLVALTFDDGPTEEGVAIAIAALREHGATATFFLIGEEAARRAPLVRRLLAEGHEVGNHSQTHQRMIFHLPAFYEREVMEADAALRAAGVTRLDLFRPPYGRKLIGLPNALARHGYRMIMWDVEDPTGAATPQAYADAVVRQARPGSIILMHIMYRSNRIARESLPLVLRGLRSRGFLVVTVGELLHQRG